MSLSERLAARNLGRDRVRVPDHACVSAWPPGSQPQLGVAAALGVTFAAAVVADFILGLFLFTILSFLEDSERRERRGSASSRSRA